MEDGDVLVFNPDTEFKILEEFEFDELIQRPEEVKFFTLTEQTTDFFEKLLPKKGKLSKALIQKTEYQVAAFKKLYSKLLKETPTGFESSVNARPSSLPWISYSNTNDVLRTAFGWNERWTPLYAPDRGLQPNYYVQVLDSLPKNAITYPEGPGQVLYPSTVNETKVLGPYEYTKTAYKEDGTFIIKKMPRPDTGDTAKFTGYTLGVPPLAPPAPLDGHPFLGAREAPIYIESDEPLEVLLPSMEAIFQHAVPRTANPYKDATPYMKIYDVKLSQVPWKIWRESFPPAELVEEGAPPIEIPFKSDEGAAPSKILTDVYRSRWFPGLSARLWLSTQIDGGQLVSKILQSQSGNLGPIAIPPPSILPPAVPIEGGPEDCLPTVITNFEDFASRGIFRTPRCAVCGWYGHGASTCPDRKGPVVKEYKNGGGCIPLGLVTSEREETTHEGKEAWTPGTDEKILKDYQSLIIQYTEKPVDLFAKAPEAPPMAPPPEIREFIQAIMDDQNRVPEDKANDIQVLLDDSESVLVEKIYTDKDTKQFLICQHTLSQFDGDYEKDSANFLLEWSVVDRGYKVCKFCGERIVNILQAQDEYDENGRMIQMRSKIKKPSFLPEEHLTFAASLRKLQTVFNLESPAEDIFFLMLSLIQVLPEEEQLKPVLDFVRSEVAKVNSRMAGKKLEGKEKSNVDYALSLFGLNGVVVLLQLHKPQLVPRRSFGSRPLILRGFPRDTDDSSDAPLIDSLMGALANTFESYPNTFRGTSAVLLRNILNDRKTVRKVAISSMTKQFIPAFKEKLQRSRDSMKSVDVSYIIQNTFQPPIVKPSKNVEFLPPSEKLTIDTEKFRCKDPSPPWLIPSMPFSFRQPELGIILPIRPSSKAVGVPLIREGLSGYTPTTEEVRNRLKKKVPANKQLKIVLEIDAPEFLRSVLLEWMVIVAESRTTTGAIRRFIREIRPNIERAYSDPSLLRDYLKGILIEFVSLIEGDATLTTLIERSFTDNIVIRSLFAKAEESKKSVDTLRAREREEFKDRMRRIPDAQREITKILIDKGLISYLITRSDRETFAKELDLPPPPTAEAPPEVNEDDVNIERDVGAQGEVPEVNGVELENDYGDYGDMRARNADGEEYEGNLPFADEEF